MTFDEINDRVRDNARAEAVADVAEATQRIEESLGRIEQTLSIAGALRAMSACPDALAWAESHGGDLPALWRDCPRGDWLLWYAGRKCAPRPALVLAAAACAETALPYAGQHRPACAAAIAAARAWADAPSDETRVAAYAAADAAYAAGAADAAASAAYAAADAAYAAADAVYADIVRRELAEWARGEGLV